jgi:small-conductance mechanosensitive channel
MNGQTLEDALAGIVTTIRVAIRTEFTSIWLPIQLGAILLAAALAWGIMALIRSRFDLTSAMMGWPAYVRLATRTIIDNFTVVVFIAMLAILRASIQAAVDHPRTYLLGVAIDMATAWVVINVVASVIRNQFVNRLVAVTAWTIAALSILRLLEPATDALNSLAFQVGGLRISLLLVLKTAVLLLLMVWLALALSRFVDRRLQATPDLTPSIKTLIGTAIRIVLLIFAVVLVLNAVGIDLSVLAFFSGAIGVGIGFGLQKIVSNLVSGIILLADKSVKPGDIISVGDHFGWVTNIGARYTAVDTRDGREYLIPNEDFITQRVVNWTYTNDLVRLEIKFNTTYGGNPRDAQAAAIEAALGVDRVLKTPRPICHVTNLGSNVEFVLWFWIDRPAAGVTSVRSGVLIALWEALERGALNIPKPGPTQIVLKREA